MKLTVKEALEQGYKYCCLYQDEKYYLIDSDVPFLHNKKYVLASKEPKPYIIADTLVKDLVDDYLNNQDEVYDEDGKINDLIAEKVDFSDVTRQINEAIASVKYYHPTDIQLIP